MLSNVRFLENLLWYLETWHPEIDIKIFEITKAYNDLTNPNPSVLM